MKIVIAIDGSESSKQALQMVKQSALFQTSSVDLVHVMSPIVFDAELVYPDARTQIEEYNADMRTKARQLLDAARADLCDVATVRECETHVISGSPAEEICRHADACQSDMIILGSRGLNPIKGLFLGSVSDGVLRLAPCPVLIHRPGSSSRGSPSPEAGVRIALGFDQSESANQACRFIEDSFEDGLSAVDIVAVLPTAFPYGMTYSLAFLKQLPAYRKSMEDGAQLARNRLTKSRARPEVAVTLIEDVHDEADALNTYASRHHCDLLVVGSKDKDVLDRVVLGSVSYKLAHRAEMPLLVVK